MRFVSAPSLIALSYKQNWVTGIPLLPSSSFPRDSPFNCYFKTTDPVRTHRKNLSFQHEGLALQVSRWSGSRISAVITDRVKKTYLP